MRSRPGILNRLPEPIHGTCTSRAQGSFWCVTAADTNSLCPAKSSAAATQVWDRKMDGEGRETGRIFWNAPKRSSSREDKKLESWLNAYLFIYHGKYWEINTGIHEGRTQGQLLSPWLFPLSCRERREAQKGRGGFLCRWQSLRNNHNPCTLE